MNIAALSTRTKILVALAAVAVVVFAFFGWQGVRAFMAWNSIERVAFDPAEARSALPPTTAAPDVVADSTTTTIEPQTLVSYRTVLVIGSDEKPPEVQDDSFADAVLLYLMPDDGSGPAIVSFPRDLLVTDPCTGTQTKISRTLEPCGDGISGPEHVAISIEDHTGIPVDHFTLIRFDAFEQIIDAVGGIQLCLPYAMRDGRYGAPIAPAGCSTVDGQQALAFLRSRTTQVFVDDEWVFADQLGDSGRIARHQTLLFALLDRLQLMRSPTQLAGLAEDLGDAIVLSDTIGIGELVSMAWDLRGRPQSQIRTFTVPGEGTTLPDGSYAVRPTATVRELLEG